MVGCALGLVDVLGLADGESDAAPCIDGEAEGCPLGAALGEVVRIELGRSLVETDGAVVGEEEEEEEVGEAASLVNFQSPLRRPFANASSEAAKYKASL